MKKYLLVGLLFSMAYANVSAAAKALWAATGITALGASYEAGYYRGKKAGLAVGEEQRWQGDPEVQEFLEIASNLAKKGPEGRIVQLPSAVPAERGDDDSADSTPDLHGPVVKMFNPSGFEVTQMSSGRSSHSQSAPQWYVIPGGFMRTYGETPVTGPCLEVYGEDMPEEE